MTPTETMTTPGSTLTDEMSESTPRNARHDFRRRRLRAAITSITSLQVFAGLLMLGTWQITYDMEVLPTLLNASPEQVFVFLADSTTDGTLLPNLWSTVNATLVGFALASVVGVTVGVSLALMPRVEQVLAPYLNALNSMPRIALGPILIVTFGIGQTSKIALAFTLVVFILMVNSMAGIQSAEKDHLDLMRAHGSRRIQLFTKVLLPVALPSIFAGLRLGLIYALLGVITAEMIASEVGIGSLILLYSQTFEIAGVYAMLLVLALISTLLNLVMVKVESTLFRWRPPSTRGRAGR